MSKVVQIWLKFSIFGFMYGLSELKEHPKVGFLRPKWCLNTYWTTLKQCSLSTSFVSEFRPREPRLVHKTSFFFCRHETIFFQRHENIFFLLPRNEFITRHEMSCRKTSFSARNETSCHETSFLKSPRNEFPQKEFKTCGWRKLIRDSPKILICWRKNYMGVCVTSKDYSKNILRSCN